MVAQTRFPREAWIPLLAGLYWLWHAPTHGLLGFLFSVIPVFLHIWSFPGLELVEATANIGSWSRQRQLRVGTWQRSDDGSITLAGTPGKLPLPIPQGSQAWTSTSTRFTVSLMTATA